MKSFFARRDHLIRVFSTTFVALIVGCPGNNQPAGEPPVVPPESTFIIDFDEFPGDEAAKVRVAGFDPTTAQEVPGSNWSFAALNVGVWSTVVTVTLVVPVAAFVESFNHEPVQLSNGAWQWSYQVVVAGMTYSAALTARTSGPDVNWQMLLSKEGDFTDFEWFTGTSNLVGTEGTWTVNFSPGTPTPFIGIEWHRSLTNDTLDIQYTNIVPAGSQNGGYIFAEITEEAFDAGYDIFNAGANNLTSIEWNRASLAGRVMDEAHFDDAEWHCWDEALQNVDCP